MKIKKVTTGCCGSSLETGTKIVLWVTVGIDILAVLFYHVLGQELGQSENLEPSTKHCLLLFVRVNEFFCACDTILAALTLYCVSTKKKSHWMLPFLIRCVAALLSFILAGFVFLISALFAESVGSLILDEVKKSESYVNNKTQVQDEVSSTTEIVTQKSPTILSEDFVNNITGYTRGLSIFMLLFSCLAFVLFCYMSTIVYSYYCQLKEKPSSGTNANGKRSSLLPEEDDVDQHPYSRSHSYAQAQSECAAFYATKSGTKV